MVANDAMVGAGAALSAAQSSARRRRRHIRAQLSKQLSSVTMDVEAFIVGDSGCTGL